jgi:hypothetical protein
MQCHRDITVVHVALCINRYEILSILVGTYFSRSKALKDIYYLVHFFIAILRCTGSLL